MSSLHVLVHFFCVLSLMAYALETASSESGGGEPVAAGKQCSKEDNGDGSLGGLSLFGDTNRDGLISQAALEGHALWSWARGAFVLANLDDDDFLPQ